MGDDSQTILTRLERRLLDMSLLLLLSLRLTEATTLLLAALQADHPLIGELQRRQFHYLGALRDVANDCRGLQSDLDALRSKWAN